MNKQDLLELNPERMARCDLDPEQILRWFNVLDAAWVHSGDPKMPHAELASGLCSNGYFNCSKVLCYPNLAEILALQLARKCKLSVGVDLDVWVVGSAYAAITFSYEMARVFGYPHGFVEKDPTDPSGKKMKWTERFTMPQGCSVIQAEELITTAGTFWEVRRAIKEAGHQPPVCFADTVVALVHRPPKLPVEYPDGIKVVALIEKEVWAVKPEECPLCQAGSKRVKPKTHWAELTGKA